MYYVSYRCLAACSPILKERKNVHHAVLEALNSNDEVEVKASIHAIAEFSKVSKTFNKEAIDSMSTKIQVVTGAYLHSIQFLFVIPDWFFMNTIIIYLDLCE